MSNLSNLDQRLLTAAGLLAVFLLLVFLAPPLLWLAGIALVVSAAAWEWAGLLNFSRAQRLLYLLATLAIVLASASLDLAGDALAYYPALAFWLALAPLWLWRSWPMARGLFGAAVGWLVLLPTFLATLFLREQSPGLLLAAVAIAVLADSAAYFTGRAFGKHKLAPAISPGKTWEGALGGAFSIAVYALLLASLLGYPLLPALAAFLLLFAVSVLGDLFESWIKRQAGVKDSGAWLPGHGGVLDRIDSQTAVLPVAAALWIWMK